MDAPGSLPVQPRPRGATGQPGGGRRRRRRRILVRLAGRASTSGSWRGRERRGESPKLPRSQQRGCEPSGKAECAGVGESGGSRGRGGSSPGRGGSSPGRAAPRSLRRRWGRWGAGGERGMRRGDAAAGRAGTCAAGGVQEGPGGPECCGAATRTRPEPSNPAGRSGSRGRPAPVSSRPVRGWERSARLPRACPGPAAAVKRVSDHSRLGQGCRSCSPGTRCPWLGTIWLRVHGRGWRSAALPKRTFKSNC